MLQFIAEIRSTGCLGTELDFFFLIVDKGNAGTLNFHTVLIAVTMSCIYLVFLACKDLKGGFW